MLSKPMIALSALLVSPSVWAQPTPQTEPTALELACQLSVECSGSGLEGQKPEVDAANLPIEPEAADRRKPQTRGFTIERRAPQKNAPQNAQVTSSKAKPSAPGKGTKASNVKSSVLPRADLRVSFISGSAELTEVGRRRAATFAKALRLPALSGSRFIISGHTDAVGSRDQNLELSRRRAQAVVDYLASKGADASRFEVQGYGFDRPLPGFTPKASENRRVEVLRTK